MLKREKIMFNCVKSYICNKDILCIYFYKLDFTLERTFSPNVALLPQDQIVLAPILQ